MRFASLALERYGRFAGCELTFRSGAPDLHIVYGANEAGKTTSLAAVSDLLFGFQARSPYNFVFDYSLLRVGAVLEDDGRTFACRRKKGTSGTLIGPDDKPLDEGALLAMLRGQTRDTFGLSFSLDQDGLRAGGRAMVEARNDVGRALFAAGSGLTGVSTELARLESEADAIWGPRAAARRSFTQAQRDLAEHARLARDGALKPKTWLDARAAAAGAQTALDEAQRRRDEILSEVRRAERVRRIASSVRLRADHVAALAGHDGTVDIADHRADAAEASMAEAEAAVRDKAAAELLAREARAKMDLVPADPEILGRAEDIDALVTSSGAIDKARRDLTRLTVEQAGAAALVERLREEAGDGATVPPSRIASSRLRELAAANAQDASALAQIVESEETLAGRREDLVAKTRDRGDSHALAKLVAAVDAARALGADADARCASARHAADVAAGALDLALARLAPWAGDAAALFVLPRVSREEVDQARTALAEVAADAVRDELAATRADEEAASLALQMTQLASGTAVSLDEVVAARATRSDRWRPLREHVLSRGPLPSPVDAVAAFEATLADADERSDRRFAAADESSRLSLLEQRRAALLLEVEQAERRAASARTRMAALRAAWAGRLVSAGYPDLEPTRFLGWLTDRDAAEAADAAKDDAARAATVAHTRRAAIRSTLAATLTPGRDNPTGDDLAPLLARAERLRKDGEQAEQQDRVDAATLAQIDQDRTDLRRRRTRLENAIQARAALWQGALAETGLALEIGTAAATLDVLDELRAAMTAQAELGARIDGIERDARDHDDRIGAVAAELTVGAAGTAAETLGLLRARLTVARSAVDVLGTLRDTVERRTAEVNAADARLSAARAALRPLLEETGSEDAEALCAAIERSRAIQTLRGAIAALEATIVSDGDGYALEDLLAAATGADTDTLAARSDTLARALSDLNAEVAAAATAHGDAKRAFASLAAEGGTAVDAATDAGQARAELGVLAEHYILKRAQAVTLRWAIERYRERHQDPMLLRASELFAALTVGRYTALRIDADGATPRLLGLRDDSRTVIEVGAMSEGTTDQLFLALRLAAVEQSVAAGVRLPFLADDLFVNFDDERSEAGFRVLAELARSTQVLFFTHHPHLAAIAHSVVGADLHSECALA